MERPTRRVNITEKYIHVSTSDVEAGYGEAFSKWYNEVHIPQLLVAPGWESARRYECVQGEPQFLAIYDLTDPVQAFNSPEFDFAFGWDEFARRIRGSHGRNYRQIFEAGTPSKNPSLIHVSYSDVEPGYEEAFSKWYNEVHVPQLLASPGWVSARRYECVGGEPRFLAIYDIENTDEAFNSPEFNFAFGWDEFARRIRNSHGRNYRQIFEAGTPSW